MSDLPPRMGDEFAQDLDEATSGVPPVGLSSVTKRSLLTRFVGWLLIVLPPLVPIVIGAMSAVANIDMFRDAGIFLSVLVSLFLLAPLYLGPMVLGVFVLKSARR